MNPVRIIISGGGTGGHIFPAIAIANAIRSIHPDAEILFVGAEGKMEMEKVPQAGYRIIGLPIAGIQRKLTWKNLVVAFKLWKSLHKARQVIHEFKPHLAIGVGGYASGPLLSVAARMGIPTLIQEQNSFPGITNKLLAKRVNRICVAYDGMEKWFPKEKIIQTGNPVRKEVVDTSGKRERALTHFALDPNKKTLLIIGGSLGARTINESVQKAATGWIGEDLQIIWQTGKSYYQTAREFASDKPHLHAHEFIREMDLAYAVADLIVSRAGAMSIAELCLVGKPCILVPSPNVAEDHQTHNAKALSGRGAAILITDAACRDELGRSVSQLIASENTQKQLSAEIRKLGKSESSTDIARIALGLIPTS